MVLSGRPCQWLARCIVRQEVRGLEAGGGECSPIFTPYLGGLLSLLCLSFPIWENPQPTVTKTTKKGKEVVKLKK